MAAQAPDSPATAPAAPPALAEELEQALPCPLCDYDLRGLPAGRCPECGHAFDPAEMRLKARTRHERLFEHHHRRPVRSFLRTLLVGWRPKRIWATLTPSAPIVPRRLAIYALLILLLGSAGAMAGFLSDVAQETRWTLEWRSQEEAYYMTAPPPVKRQLDQGTPGGNFLAYVYTSNPLPTQSQFWRQFAWQGAALRGLPLGLLVVAWPGFTIATLLIFRRSLRQAKIHFGHVARVTIYSGDVFAFTLPVLLLMAALESVGNAAHRGHYSRRALPA